MTWLRKDTGRLVFIYRRMCPGVSTPYRVAEVQTNSFSYTKAAENKLVPYIQLELNY